MRIMVFDVPAENGGALSILKKYYADALNDNKHEWIFVVSTPQLAETENVKVINYPWIKKSWLHRLYFDKFIAHKLVKKYNVDEVLTLQNVVIPKVNIKQTLYLHQPLPFVEKRYKITDNLKFWIYQNIISRFIYKSIKKADKIIVQTNWILNAASVKAKVSKDKFILEPPILNVQAKVLFSKPENNIKTFFYPAGGYVYKNHNIIVEACKILKEIGIEDYKVLFTLNGNENRHIKKLKKIVQEVKLPIYFIGEISVDEVFNYYSKTILLFPSYIETFGLPLLEAKMHQCPIVASNCAFSREILSEYDKVFFFDPFSSNALLTQMKKFIR